jgi:hypothetical protein
MAGLACKNSTIVIDEDSRRGREPLPLWGGGFATAERNAIHSAGL